MNDGTVSCISCDRCGVRYEILTRVRTTSNGAPRCDFCGAVARARELPGRTEEPPGSRWRLRAPLFRDVPPTQSPVTVPRDGG